MVELIGEVATGPGGEKNRKVMILAPLLEVTIGKPTTSKGSLRESMEASAPSLTDAPKLRIDGLVLNTKDCLKLLEGLVPLESKEKLLE